MICLILMFILFGQLMAQETTFIQKTTQSCLKTVTHQNNKVSQKKKIIITNSITPEMLTCNHWTGNHQPDSFSLTVDGFILKEGEKKELIPKNNEIEVTYHYSFAKGLYKGVRSYRINVPDKTTYATLAFSWKKEPRIWLDILG